MTGPDFGDNFEELLFLTALLFVAWIALIVVAWWKLRWYYALAATAALPVMIVVAFNV